MKRKQFICSLLAAAICLSAFVGCSRQQEDEDSGSQVIQSAVGEETVAKATDIVLSDDGITVEGKAVADGEEADGVRVGGEIIYYHNTDSYESGNPYGEGTAADKHTKAEAAEHTLVTITQSGTYRISGTLSKGQLAVDLGEDSVSDPSATVTLVLCGADINCDIAPAVIFYNVYECSDDSLDTKGTVDTTEAGANVIIADDSENHISGSYVAKIYKDNSEQKKLAKYDGAFYSKRTMNVDGEANGTGRLYIEAENEGLDSELHLTVNGGNIYITAQNDGINTNEDNISVTTINGGYLCIDAGLGEEGDGIDSNGYLTINGGTVLTVANGKNGDGGIDAEFEIAINGGTVMAFGSRNDSVSEASTQNCIELSFNQSRTAAEGLTLTDALGNTIMKAICEREFSSVTLSSPQLEQNVEYSLYIDGAKQSYTATGINFEGGMKPIRGDFGGIGKIMPTDPIVTELPEGFEEWLKSDYNIPDNIREWLEGISRALTGQPIEVPVPVEPKPELETKGEAGGNVGAMSAPAERDEFVSNGTVENNVTAVGGDVFILTDRVTSFIGVKNA